MAPSEICFYSTAKGYQPTEEELRRGPVGAGTGILQVNPGKSVEVSTPASGRVKVTCSQDNQTTNVISEIRKETLADSSDWFPVPSTTKNSPEVRILVRHVTVPNFKVGQHFAAGK